jgi:Flp pilus assembly protein TadD
MMKKLFIIASMVTLLTCIVGQGNQANAQHLTGKLIYGIALMQNTGRVATFIRGENMSTNFISQGLFETNVNVGDYFAVERENTPYNGTLSWPKTANVLQVVNSGNGNAVFRAIGPGGALLAITPEGQSDPSLLVRVKVSQTQSLASGPAPATRPGLAPQQQDPALELQKQGIEYRKRKMFTQAVQAFNQALEMNPRNAGLYVHRGITYLIMKNPDSAIADFNQALSLATRGQDVIYYYRGGAYGSKKQYDAALKDFNEALKTNPNANKYFLRGLAYRDKGQYLSAIGDFDQAIKLNPSDPRPYFGKASALDRSGQQREAIDAYQVYLRFAKDPKTIQRANERISELKQEVKPVARKAKPAEKTTKTEKAPAEKPVAKEPAGRSEDLFSGPLGEETF